MSKEKELYSDGDLLTNIPGAEHAPGIEQDEGLIRTIYKSAASKAVIPITSLMLTLGAIGCGTDKTREPATTGDGGSKARVADSRGAKEMEFSKPADKEFYTPYRMENGVIGVYVPSGGLIRYVPNGDGTYLAFYHGDVTPIEVAKALGKVDFDVR